VAGAGWVDPGRWWALALVALVLLSAAVVGGTVAQRAPLGVYDEWVFLDAVDKASRANLTQQGERMDQYALHISSCRGVGDTSSVGSPCGGVLEPTMYPQTGITTADIHPPVYFVLAAAGAEVVQLLTPLDEPLDSARLVGGVWLGAGLLLVVALARELGATRVAAVLAAITCLALPLVRSVSTHLTPDALALVAGAGVGLATLWWQRGRSWLWLAGASALAASVKAPFVLAVAACAVVVLLSAGTWRRRATGVVALGLPAALVTVGWLEIRQRVAVAPSPAQAVILTDMSWDTVVADLDVVLGLPEDACNSVLGCGLGLAVGVFWSVAALVALVRSAGSPDRRRLAVWWVGVGTAALAAGPLAQLALQLATGGVFATPPRYAIALVPIAAALAMASVAQTSRHPSSVEEPSPATSTA
jgi:hypothetical protein